MKKTAMWWAILVAGCGPNFNDGPTKDAGTTGDGGTATAGNVPCDKTSTSSVTAPAGTKTVTVSRFSLIDLDPTEPFEIEECDQITTPPTGTGSAGCPAGYPAGYTCTVTGDPFPTGACYWTKDGAFYNGKLYVACSSSTTAYAADGVTVTSMTMSGWATIRLHH